MFIIGTKEMSFVREVTSYFRNDGDTDWPHVVSRCPAGSLPAHVRIKEPIEFYLEGSEIQ